MSAWDLEWHPSCFALACEHICRPAPARPLTVFSRNPRSMVEMFTVMKSSRTLTMSEGKMLMSNKLMPLSSAVTLICWKSGRGVVSQAAHAC